MAEGDVPFKDYVDSQLHEVRRAAELAAETPTEQVPLKEFVEAILDEQRRGMLVAEQEREKSARALRAELERSIKEGDTNLREHIAAQVGQIREALFAQEKLDVQRHATGDMKTESVQREMRLINEASAEAIAKAEVATDKRLQALNELRSMVTDAQQQFMPREVADNQLAELRKQLTAVVDRLNTMVGWDTGQADRRRSNSSAATIAIGVLALLVSVLSIVVVVILANGAGPQ